MSGAGDPRPAASTATARILVSLRVRATPERAFAVFTGDIALWWRPNELFRFTPRSPGVLAFAPGPGGDWSAGRFTETLSNGKVFEIGRITAWEPPARLAFTWRQASFAPDQETRVEVRFEPVAAAPLHPAGAAAAETRVTVEHTGWDAVPTTHVARHGFPDGLFLHRHGAWWQSLLAGLAQRLG